jgi:hypothetical protein
VLVHNNEANSFYQCNHLYNNRKKTVNPKKPHIMEKKIIWAGLAGGVAFFFLGWLFYGILLKDFYSAQSTISGINKEPPDFPFLVLGNMANSFLLAIILGRWAKISTATDGAKIGLLSGLLLGGGIDLIMYSTTNIMSLTGALADIAVVTIMWMITGGIQGMMFGSSSKTVS